MQLKIKKKVKFGKKLKEMYLKDFHNKKVNSEKKNWKNFEKKVNKNCKFGKNG